MMGLNSENEEEPISDIGCAPMKNCSVMKEKGNLINNDVYGIVMEIQRPINLSPRKFEEEKHSKA